MKFSTDRTVALGKISKETLLNNIDQCQVWSDLLQISLYINPSTNKSRTFCNPWRKDHNPKCYLFEYRGQIRMADFADYRFHRMGVIDAWMHVHRVSFPIAILRIAQVYLSGQQRTAPKLRVLPKQDEFEFEIYYKIRPWLEADKEYWSQYGIGRRQLEKEKIFPINYLAFNTQSNPDLLTNIKVEFIAYAIDINGRLKVYMPGRTPKTIHNVKGSDIGGRSRIDKNDPIFILNKSAKDHMVCVNEGYNSRFLMNEGVKPSKYYIEKLASQFEYIFVFMDNDEAGVRESHKVSEYCNHISQSEKFLPLTIPNFREDVKDISDYHKHYGNSKILNALVDETIKNPIPF